MRLLASTDFALRVLMLLASAPPGQSFNVEVLSRTLGNLSRNHLHKIVQNLATLGVVRTVRGAGGGALLATAPEEIRLGSLIRQLEGDQAVVECFQVDGGNCILTTACRLRGMIADARDDFYRSLDGHTLADCLPRSRAVALPDKRARTAKQ